MRVVYHLVPSVSLWKQNGICSMLQQPAERAIQEVVQEFAIYAQKQGNGFETTKRLLAGDCKKEILQQIVFGIIKIDPRKRVQWMVNEVAKCLQKMSFFQNNLSKIQECCKHMRYRRVPSHDQIITYGADPDYFYVLMEGEVNVYIKKTNEEVETQKEELQNHQSQRGKDANCLYLSQNHFVQKGLCKFKYCKTLRQGDSFGQLGMLYNKPRMAIVQSKTPCILGTLRKEDYISIFFQQERLKRNLKKKFITEVVLTQMRQMRYQVVESILYQFEETALTINDYLFKEGDPFKTFYIIYSGEVLLYYLQGRTRKPISRMGQGGVICAEQLKVYLSNGDSTALEYSAQVSSSHLVVYKLQAYDVLKIFDYKKILGSMLLSIPEARQQQIKVKKSILQQFRYTEPSNKPQKLDTHSLKSFMKNKILLELPHTSKTQVAQVRLKRLKKKSKIVVEQQKPAKRSFTGNNHWRLAVRSRERGSTKPVESTMSDSFAGRNLNYSGISFLT